MDFLFISGSSVPTKCGVGKFTDKILTILKGANFQVSLISNQYQKLEKTNALKVELPYPVVFIDIKFSNLFKIFKIIQKLQPKTINIQYNSIDLGRSLFPSFLAIFIRLRFPGVKLQVTIHEFSSYTMLGKIRHIIPTLVAYRVFFSDRRQMESAINFSFKLIQNKSSILSLGSVVNYVPPQFKPTFSLPQETLHIAFHGFIQPKNGIEFLLQALVILKQQNIKFKLHILGDFKLLMNYGNLQNQIFEYQKLWLDYINKNLADEVVIHGDIEPDSDQFRDILKQTEIAIIPDVDGMTIRRTSFWNIFMQSQDVMFASYDNLTSDLVFEEFINFQPSDVNSLAKAIINYQNLDKTQKQKIWDKQNEIKQNMSLEKIVPKIIDSLTN